MWVKCPICNGTGIITKDYSENNCKTCNGKGIISEITGLPPSSTPAPFKGLLQGIKEEKIKRENENN